MKHSSEREFAFFVEILRVCRLRRTWTEYLNRRGGDPNMAPIPPD